MATNQCIIMNDIQKSENSIFCLARVDDFTKMLKRVSIGECVTSLEPIDLEFANSIGRSQWMLILYPKGQYINGLENGIVSVYLKMTSCDNEDKSLVADVRFFIKSPYLGMKDQFVTKKTINFLYRDVKRRWERFELVGSEELYSNQFKNLFLNESLTIGCELIVRKYFPPRVNSLGYFPRWNESNLRNRYADSVKTLLAINAKEQSSSLVHSHSVSRKNCTSLVRESSPPVFTYTAKRQKKEVQQKWTKYPLKENVVHDHRTWEQRLLSASNNRFKECYNENKWPNMTPKMEQAKENVSHSEDLKAEPQLRRGVKEIVDYFETFSINGPLFKKLCFRLGSTTGSCSINK